MAALRAKLDVYPLENYVLRPLDGPLAAVLAAGGGGGKNSSNSGGSGGGGGGGGGASSSSAAAAAAAAGQQQRRRVRTPLEKLVTLKKRVQAEQQAVQSVEGVCVVHLHDHPHVLLLRQTLRRNRDAAGQRIVPTGQTNADVSYRLPGGRCRRGEAEETCLLRKLGRCLLSEAKQPTTGDAAGGTTATLTMMAATRLSQSLHHGGGGGGGDVSGSGSIGGGGGGGGHHDGLIVGDMSSSMMMAAGGSSGGGVGHATDDGGVAALGGGGGGVAVSEAGAYFRVGDLLARWYRPHYSPLVYPYVPPHLTLADVKEVRSVYLVHLEPMAYLRIAHSDVELVAVPLFDLHDNAGKYGAVLAALPAALSRLTVNYCNNSY